MMIQRQPYANISKQLVMPLMQPDSVGYLKPDFLGWTLHITHPEAAKEVFLKSDLYPKANAFRESGETFLITFVGTQNILFATGKEEWLKHRKLVNPAFHKSMPITLFSSLTHKVFQVLDRTNETPIDATLLMGKFTLEAIGAAGFGFDFDAILNEDSEWVKIYEGIKKGLMNPFFFLFPWLELHFLWLFPKRQEQHTLVHRFHAMLDNVIENKRRLLQQQGGKDAIDTADKDILTLMLEGELSGEGALTNEELKSNLNIFFLAGHDTTANALAFAIHALARDPELQQQARNEAISVLGDAPKDITPTRQELSQLAFIDHIIKETLRLNAPAITGIPRVVTSDTMLADHTWLPQGTPVVVNTYDLHHNPHVWDHPDTFDPSRFAPGGEAEQKTGMPWVPFYYGQRMCIGMQFSLAEQRVMLSSLLRKYEWWLPEDSIHKENVITGNIGILSPNDLKVIFKRRY
ncbi:cytochrome P450 [Chlamydoabsidia padenii]|nr:cytochrome P450 [Chlamydoabsidia padenii]